MLPETDQARLPSLSFHTLKSRRATGTTALRFFANTTDVERDLIAYWQMVKLVEEAHLRYAREGDT